MYYDRKGKKISLHEWAAVLGDKATDQRRVALDEFPGGARVSTVWLGLEHGSDAQGRPLIFESMVFPAPESFSEQDSNRYATEEEALEGHKAMVAKWRGKLS